MDSLNKKYLVEKLGDLRESFSIYNDFFYSFSLMFERISMLNDDSALTLCMLSLTLCMADLMADMTSLTTNMRAWDVFYQFEQVVCRVLKVNMRFFSFAC